MAIEICVSLLTALCHICFFFIGDGRHIRHGVLFEVRNEITLQRVHLLLFLLETMMMMMMINYQSVALLFLLIFSLAQ